MRRCDFVGLAAAGRKNPCRAIVVALLLLSSACSVALSADSKRVMLLHSFGRDFKPWSEYAKAIRTELERLSPWPLTVSEHSLEITRAGDEVPEGPFTDYLSALFAKRAPDLIVSIGAPAAAFVQRHRQRLFPETPMVFTVVDQRRVQYSTLTSNDTVVAVAINYFGAIENILRVLPNTKNVAVVVGASPIEKYWREEIGKEVKPFENRIAFTWYNQLSFEDILKHAAALPAQSAIFWELMIVDAAGVVHEEGKALARLHAVATAPIFSYTDAFFGREIVGGPHLPVLEYGKQVAGVAVRILGGEKAGDIKIPPIGFAAPKFDWRQMQRWGISEKRLPPGSEIHFREPTIWQQYFWRMVAILVALAMQTWLIIALVWEDRRRRRSEANARALASELAHMNRIATAGQLTASIAHEIRQPLSSISSFGIAGLNWLKREPPNLDNVRSGLENIVKAVHRVDDVIKGVTTLFRNEPTTRTEVYVNALVEQVLISTARARDSNGVLLQTNLVKTPPPYVMADPGQLQQVVLNLITNAIDAMSASQRGARILRVDTNVDQANFVVITVADSGPGIDPKIVEQLFKPFFTTKSSGMGLGLPICKSIVEAHQGKLTAATREPHGAVFRIELPRHRREPDRRIT
jgi:signal transduction histidine kinase